MSFERADEGAPQSPGEAVAAVGPRSEDEHVAVIREKGQAFMDALVAANDAGVSQAIVLPMLLEMLRDSGMGFDPSAMMGMV